jgi:hypothetical protein
MIITIDIISDYSGDLIGDLTFAELAFKGSSCLVTEPSKCAPLSIAMVL